MQENGLSFHVEQLSALAHAWYSGATFEGLFHAAMLGSDSRTSSQAESSLPADGTYGSGLFELAAAPASHTSAIYCCC